jgi:hypothetical protein
LNTLNIIAGWKYFVAMQQYFIAMWKYFAAMWKYFIATWKYFVAQVPNNAITALNDRIWLPDVTVLRCANVGVCDEIRNR